MRRFILVCVVFFGLGPMFAALSALSQTSGAGNGSAAAARPPVASGSDLTQKDGVAQAMRPSSAQDTIAPGTQITMQNWQNYKQFMPDGMVSLFQGRYYWKMPPDVEMDVGPTVIRALPKDYLEATEKYSAQVKIVDLGGGGLTLQNYQGGRPFPDPQEPHKGWKLLANVWFRYLPHLLVDIYGAGCYQDSYGSINCSADEIVYRQLSFNTDPGVPTNVPGAEG